MRSVFRKVLVVLVAAFALGAVAAASAFASPEWYLNGKKVTESTSVTDKGKINLKVNGEEETVTCSLSGKGTVGPGGTGSVTESKLSECNRKVLGESQPLCDEKQTTTAIHLPWRTTLGGSEKTRLHNWLENSGAGLPAWKWECRIREAPVEQKYKMECEGDVINHVENKGSGVFESFAATESPEFLHCTRSITTYFEGKSTEHKSASEAWNYDEVNVSGPVGKELSVK